VDEHLFGSFYAALDGSLTGLAAAFTVVGGGWITLALLPLLFVRRHRDNALALAGVLLVTAAAVAGLKLLVRRARPCNGLAGVRCLWGDAPTDFSFPSGHAAGSFAFVGFVIGVMFLTEESASGLGRGGWRKRLLAALLVFAAGCIALSRVYLGVHFPGDVAAGACLGAVLGLGGARLHVQRSLRPPPPDPEA
jgi:undecaprenyl-diphosphatase